MHTNLSFHLPISIPLPFSFHLFLSLFFILDLLYHCCALASTSALLLLLVLTLLMPLFLPLPFILVTSLSWCLSCFALVFSCPYHCYCLFPLSLTCFLPFSLLSFALVFGFFALFCVFLFFAPFPWACTGPCYFPCPFPCPCPCHCPSSNNQKFKGMFKKHRQDCEHPYSQLLFCHLICFYYWKS